MIVKYDPSSVLILQFGDRDNLIAAYPKTICHEQHQQQNA